MKFIVVAGARPNFMKVAPILEAFRHTAAQVLFVHTGQHYGRAMSEDFLADLGLPAPDINLGVGPGTHAVQTARILTAFEPVCAEQRPDCVIVVGDVNSTLACALAAKKMGIPVAHVEAGLRSGDMSMPEEINRLCTDAMSDLLFTTDEIASGNLRREGIPEERIHLAGNTMIDTLLRHIDCARGQPPPAGLGRGQYAVMTLHRPGNVDCPQTLRSILGTANSISERIPIVFPVHPRTRENLSRFDLLDSVGKVVHLIEPMRYLPFIGLVANSRLVLTDSGGIQEETTALGIPCVTMRQNTERPITCRIGTNVLAGADPVRIRHAAFQALEGTARPSSIPEKWDGRAGERIVGTLLHGHSFSGR